MTKEEREEMRRKIREMLDKVEDPAEETDPIRKKNQNEDYPLVVEEEDPDWPRDADGWGFNFGQFFDKITIKNVKNDNEDYDSESKIVWQDNYIKPIRDITAEEWEDTVFKDFNPLVIPVHHRFKRPRASEKAQIELEKAVKLFWKAGLPSPRRSMVSLRKNLYKLFEYQLFLKSYSQKLERYCIEIKRFNQAMSGQK